MGATLKIKHDQRENKAIFKSTQMKYVRSWERERERERETYRVRGWIEFAEKCGLSKIAEIEGSLVLENVEVVVIAFKNWGTKDKAENNLYMLVASPNKQWYIKTSFCERCNTYWWSLLYEQLDSSILKLHLLVWWWSERAAKLKQKERGRRWWALRGPSWAVMCVFVSLRGKDKDGLD